MGPILPAFAQSEKRDTIADTLRGALIPLRDLNPTRRFPIITVALIVATVLVFT